MFCGYLCNVFFFSQLHSCSFLNKSSSHKYSPDIVHSCTCTCACTHVHVFVHYKYMFVFIQLTICDLSNYSGMKHKYSPNTVVFIHSPVQYMYMYMCLIIIHVHVVSIMYMYIVYVFTQLSICDYSGMFNKVIDQKHCLLSYDMSETYVDIHCEHNMLHKKNNKQFLSGLYLIQVSMA